MRFYTHEELATFSVREACFFGNLFTQEGIFLGVDRAGGLLATRACGVLSDSGSTACAPFVLAGSCQQFCKQDGAHPLYKIERCQRLTARDIDTALGLLWRIADARSRAVTPHQHHAQQHHPPTQ